MTEHDEAWDRIQKKGDKVFDEILSVGKEIIKLRVKEMENSTNNKGKSDIVHQTMTEHNTECSCQRLSDMVWNTKGCELHDRPVTESWEENYRKLEENLANAYGLILPQEVKAFIKKEKEKEKEEGRKEGFTMGQTDIMFRFEDSDLVKNARLAERKELRETIEKYFEGLIHISSPRLTKEKLLEFLALSDIEKML